MREIFHIKILIRLLQFHLKTKNIFHEFMIILKQWIQIFRICNWHKMNYLNLKKTFQIIKNQNNIQSIISKIKMIIRNLFSWIHMMKMSKVVTTLNIVANSRNSIISKVTHIMKYKIINNHLKKNKFSVKFQENWTIFNNNLNLQLRT